MALNKNDMNSAAKHLLGIGGTANKNSAGINVGGTTYKASKSGGSVITNHGKSYSSLRDLKKATK